MIKDKQSIDEVLYEEHSMIKDDLGWWKMKRDDGGWWGMMGDAEEHRRWICELSIDDLIFTMTVWDEASEIILWNQIIFKYTHWIMWSYVVFNAIW